MVCGGEREREKKEKNRAANAGGDEKRDEEHKGEDACTSCLN